MITTETPVHLSRKISSAEDLKGVVRTMKTIAASNIVQYEEAVNSLVDYARTVELALAVCFKTSFLNTTLPQKNELSQGGKYAGAIVFGTDQGLVGQFNEVLANFAKSKLNELHGKKLVWTIGERMRSQLIDYEVDVSGVFDTPNSVAAISQLIGQLLIETESHQLNHESSLYLFYNRAQSRRGSVNTPVCMQLLPLDANWQQRYRTIPWPTKNLPQIVGNFDMTVRALIREYLFVSLFKASAESLAGENASRLASMQRAEKNIIEMLDELNRSYHQMRQRSIDEELFDVISGYESGAKK